MTAKQPKADFKRLGRLTSFGLTEPWQAALFLPASFEDLSSLRSNVHELDQDPAPIKLQLAGTPRAYYNGAPRLVLPMRDQAGETFRATIFGNTKEWMETLSDFTEGCFIATGGEWNGHLDIKLIELVEPEWVGRVRPKYSGVKQVITPQTARRLVLTLLPEAIPAAADFIAKQVGAPTSMESVLHQVGASGWTLEQLLLQAHQPMSLRHAEHATKVLRRIAAICALQSMHEEVEHTAPNPISHTTLQQRIAQLPFANLTGDQLHSIEAISLAMASNKPARIINTGEVGTGKTAVAAVVSAATVDAVPGGGSVMVLCPNTLLAKQLYAEFTSYYPDIAMQLVIGDTPQDVTLDASIFIGTSALLHRKLDHRRFDLLIIDEQHRWSREQREQYRSPTTHLLEMSATPIPRSLALVRYGKYQVVPMKETHAKKEIHTHVYVAAEGRRAMFKGIDATIKRGCLMLIVHPKKSSDPDADEQQVDLLGDRSASPPESKATPRTGIDDRHSVQQARERWEALYPGKVGSLTSDDEEGVKTQVLQALKDRRIQICLCTTVIEVGITIPELFHIVIVCPERLGLMQLHQLRGRVARGGGKGHCILYCPEPINEKQRRRLEFFKSTTDGFELAEYDMRERGIGNISATSSKQSGSDDTFLYGVKMDVNSLDDVVPLVTQWKAAKADASRMM